MGVCVCVLFTTEWAPSILQKGQAQPNFDVSSDTGPPKKEPACQKEHQVPLQLAHAPQGTSTNGLVAYLVVFELRSLYA